LFLSLLVSLFFSQIDQELLVDTEPSKGVFVVEEMSLEDTVDDAHTGHKCDCARDRVAQCRDVFGRGNACYVIEKNSAIVEKRAQQKHAHGKRPAGAVAPERSAHFTQPATTA
jgi:hypothetical protein